MSDPKSFLATDFGAVADGTTNNAWAIQRTIDACAAGGGGRVVLPSGGIYLSGKIFLRSKIEFHLESGATLLCSPYIEDIASPAKKGGVAHGFLCAEDAEDISVTGSGVLDETGDPTWRNTGRTFMS